MASLQNTKYFHLLGIAGEAKKHRKNGEGWEHMTIKELFKLNREIEMDMRRLEKLRANPTAESRADRYAIMTLEAAIKAKQQQYISESICLEEFIKGIDDSLTRIIFTLRCIDGLNWAQVADFVGGRNTEISVKMRFYRHLKKTGIE